MPLYNKGHVLREISDPKYLMFIKQLQDLLDLTLS
jgi:hypothetical protein